MARSWSPGLSRSSMAYPVRALRGCSRTANSTLLSAPTPAPGSAARFALLALQADRNILVTGVRPVQRGRPATNSRACAGPLPQPTPTPTPTPTPDTDAQARRQAISQEAAGSETQEGQARAAGSANASGAKLREDHHQEGLRSEEDDAADQAERAPALCARRHQPWVASKRSRRSTSSK